MVIRILSILKNSQSGMVLPMALVLLIIASIIIVPGLWAMQSFMTINSNVEQDTIAYYAADAGVADCIWKYRYGTAPTASYTLSGINGMNVDVTLLPQSTTTKLFWQSSAPSGLAPKATIVIQVNKESGTQGVFNQAAVSLNGNINLTGNANISSNDPSVTLGDAYANGKIYNSKGKYGPTIDGNASAYTTIDKYIKDGVGGTIKEGPVDSPWITVADPIDIAAYTLQAQTQGQTVASFSKSSGTWDLGGPGHPSYITGNLQLTGTAKINVVGTLYIGGTFSMANGCTMAGGNVVIVNGNVTLGGGATAELPLNQTPLVISKTGNVTLSNGSKLSAIIYAPKGAISLTGSAKVWGSLYGKSVTLGDSARLIYQAGLMGTTGLPGWIPSQPGTPTVVGYDYR